MFSRWRFPGRHKPRRKEVPQADSSLDGSVEDSAAEVITAEVSERADENKEPSPETPSPEVSARPSVAAYRPPSVNESLFPKARRIARSLQEAPEEWAQSADGFTIFHSDSGYTIWIANEDYKMGERISVDGYDRTIPYSKAEAMIIWPAVASALRHIGEREASEFFDKPVKARLRQCASNDTWVCQDIAAEKPWVAIGQTPDEAYRTWLGANYPRYREDVMQGRPMVVWRG